MIVEQACDSIWIFEVDLQTMINFLSLPNVLSMMSVFVKKAG